MQNFRLFRLLLALLIIAAVLPTYTPPLHAAAAPQRGQFVSALRDRLALQSKRTSRAAIEFPFTGLWFNAGGGALANGTDGMRFVFHCDGNSSEQVWFTGLMNYYRGTCSYTGFHAKVGGMNFGVRANPWTSATIREYYGSATLDQGTAKGDGYAVIDYTATVDEFTYSIAREISYTYPNKFFTERYIVTVPANAPSQTISLAKGGDTYPGGMDSGIGAMVEAPFKTVLSIEPNARKILGFREAVPGTLSHIFSGLYVTANDLTVANDAFTDSITTTQHDTGLVAQFLVPHTTAATDTTYERSMETLTTFQALDIQASFENSVAYSSSTLTMLLSNYWTDASFNATNIGYTFSLPAPLTVSGPVTTTCADATVTAMLGANTIVVSGASLTYLSTCQVSAPVSVPTAAHIELTAALVSGMTAMGATFLNNVATSSIDFVFGQPTSTRTIFPTASDTPTPTITPSPTFTNTKTSTPTKTPTLTYTASNTPTETFTPSATKTYTASKTFTSTRTFTVTRTPTKTFTSSPTGTFTRTNTFTITRTPSPTDPVRAPGEIPTTSDPTINTSNAGVRSMANTSFEHSDTGCSLALGSWAYVRQEHMAGWFTAHPAIPEGCDSASVGGTSYRVIELNMPDYAPDGRVVASLNADVASFLYQKLCVRSGETFDFSFFHNIGSPFRTDIAAFRLGIPTGLPADSVAADTYSREIMRVSSTTDADGLIVTGVAHTDGAGTTNGAAVIDNTWGKYSGTHTLPAIGYDGIRNIGFYGIQSISPGAGNLLDNITLGLTPFMDMGASRDATVQEGAAQNVYVRINGRVSAGTTVVVRKREGSAVSDSDFSIGTISAGANGTATVTHTEGSDIWVIEVPAGDYDGGIYPSNNAGGLTIPVDYVYDLLSDGGEYAMFQLGAPGDDGASTNWELTDPTCDGSFKDDGVVHSIENLAPTMTSTHTPTLTDTPTNTETPTYTPTATRTPTASTTPTITPTPSAQDVLLPALPDVVTGASAVKLPTSSAAGLSVTYSTADAAVCTMVGSALTIRAPGTCTLIIDIAGGTVDGVPYAPSRTTRTFVVKAAQTLTFVAPGSKVYTSGDFTLSGSASSGLPVMYSSETPSICSVTSGGTVHLITVGTCTIAAQQTGGTIGGLTYAGAPSVKRSFAAVAVPQTLVVPTVSSKHYYDPAFRIGASSSSGLAPVYTSTTPVFCTVDDEGAVHLFVAGTCLVTVAQPGGTRAGTIYAAAPSMTYRVTIDNATPTLTSSRTRTSTNTNTRTKTMTPTPTPIQYMMKKGAIGASFVLGLLQNGTLVTWGMNKEYQTNISPCCGSGIDDIATGSNFALVLKGGRVYGWGSNSLKQLIFPKQTTKSIIAIAAGQAHGLALSKKGTIYAWGDASFAKLVIPKAAVRVVAIAGGADHSLAVKADGSVVGWGSNSAGQVKIPPGLQKAPKITAKKAKAVTAGLDHSVALLADGSIIAWGGNAKGQSTVPNGLGDVKTISAGNKFTMALKNDGTVFGWGDPTGNQIKLPDSMPDVFTVYAGYANSIIGLRNGGIIVLGDQTNGIAASRTPTKTATPTP